MSGDSYITNPSAQQGESTLRKGTRGPANSNATIQADINPDDRADEGPVGVPEHAGKPGDRTIHGGKTPSS